MTKKYIPFWRDVSLKRQAELALVVRKLALEGRRVDPDILYEMGVINRNLINFEKHDEAVKFKDSLANFKEVLDGFPTDAGTERSAG